MTSVRVPPATDDDWKRQMERDGLTGQTIHGQIFPSASKFTRKDFLTMRILRQPVKPDNFNFENFGLGQDLIRDAKKRLSRYKSWESYRNSFRKGKHPEEGSLFLVKLCQNETKGAETSEISSSISPKKTRSVTQQEETEKAGHRPQTPTTSSGMITGQEAYRQISEHIQWSEELSAEEVPLSPSSKDSSPLSEYISSEARRSRKTADEQIVNAALLNFLKAITEHFTDILHHWTIQRYPLHAVVNGVELYEARTDGCLSDGPGKFICSLIEVKAATRRDHVFEIFMQESAQIVAWILNQRDEYLKLPGRYVHNLSLFPLNPALMRSKMFSSRTGPPGDLFELRRV